MALLLPALLLLFLTGSVLAQTRPAGPPRFQDYPASETFTGVPAIPKLDTPLERSYADQIRDGLEKGYGVFRDGKEQQGPNFSGSQIVIQWGCGSPWMRMAMVDARSGKVYYPPILPDGAGAQSFDLPLLTTGNSVPRNPEVRFRTNSSLMIVKATPTEARASYTYYFLWRHKRWTLLRKARWATSERPRRLSLRDSRETREYVGAR